MVEFSCLVKTWIFLHKTFICNLVSFRLQSWIVPPSKRVGCVVHLLLVWFIKYSDLLGMIQFLDIFAPKLPDFSSRLWFSMMAFTLQSIKIHFFHIVISYCHSCSVQSSIQLFFIWSGYGVLIKDYYQGSNGFYWKLSEQRALAKPRQESDGVIVRVCL